VTIEDDHLAVQVREGAQAEVTMFQKRLDADFTVVNARNESTGGRNLEDSWIGFLRYCARAAVAIDEVLRPLRAASSSNAEFNEAGISADICGTWRLLSCLAGVECPGLSPATRLQVSEIRALNTSAVAGLGQLIAASGGLIAELSVVRRKKL
jgi:hypothetical protein